MRERGMSSYFQGSRRCRLRVTRRRGSVVQVTHSKLSGQALGRAQRRLNTQRPSHRTLDPGPCRTLSHLLASIIPPSPQEGRRTRINSPLRVVRKYNTNQKKRANGRPMMELYYHGGSFCPSLDFLPYDKVFAHHRESIPPREDPNPEPDARVPARSGRGEPRSLRDPKGAASWL